MENHPIPQDVTGFKFKLIGSVTIKQFIYLVGGGVLAAIFFMFPLPALVKFPISFLFGGIGAALAFIPIDGRPMDVMLKNFFKALPAENQYIYKKRGAEALIAEFFTPQLTTVVKEAAKSTQQTASLDAKRALLFKTLKQSYRPDEKEQAVLSNINTYLSEATHSATPPIQNVDAVPPPIAPTQLTQIVTPPAATPEKDTALDILTKPVIVTRLETPVAKPTPTIQAVEAPQFIEKPTPVVTPPEPVASPPPPTEAAKETPLVQEQKPLTTTPAPAPQQGVAPNESASVKAVGAESTLKAGFPSLPDTPNIVMGIIKDPRGKVIPNILVEIMDQQGIPVRAFKTNALGQFAAATPLPNGEYNVILEDPRKQNEFEQIHIKLDGQIFEPLEIISVDQREKLRRELFGASQTPAA